MGNGAGGKPFWRVLGVAAYESGRGCHGTCHSAGYRHRLPDGRFIVNSHDSGRVSGRYRGSCPDGVGGTTAAEEAPLKAVATPAGSAVYAINRDAYLQQLAALEQQLAETLGKLPDDRRSVVTSHDAFEYFAAAYQLKFLAPQGINTETEATAKDVAALIEQIRAEKITAVFLENMVASRLVEQIAAESGAKVGGTLYADALSPADGVAGTYLAMMKHNIDTLYQALAAN